jgi:heme exporter protein B
MSAITTLLRHELRLSLRQGGGFGAALAFMLAFLVLVPLAIGPDQATLQRLAPGLMWLALLLSILLTTERMFQLDHDDGALDLLATGTLPLEIVSMVKALAHWLAVALPLSLATPLLGLLLNLDVAAMPMLCLSMVLGSLGLSALASIAGAITAGLRRGGLVVPLLVLPLYVPIIIFGLSAAQGHLNPAGSGPSLMVLVAIVLVTLLVQPFAAAAALRAYLR